MGFVRARDSKPTDILSAKAANGIGSDLDVRDFEHIVLKLSIESTPTLTVKIQGSVDEEAPDFSAAQSSSNHWDYVAVYDLEDVSKIDGDTGVAAAGSADYRILMVNRGRSVLYGDLAEIKEQYKNNSVFVDYQGELGDELSGVIGKRKHRGYIELFLDEKTTPQKLLEQLISRGVIINRFEAASPPLNEIFLKVAGEQYE